METKKIDKPSKYDTRFITTDIELRVTDGDVPKISGYAAKFGTFTDLGWCREKIKAGAFDEALNNEDDVRCLKNHDPNFILGRTKNGTLRLSTNTVGLRFDNDMPDTTIGKDTLEEIRRGDISGASFAFTVLEDDWHYFEDKPAERIIIKIGQLFDVSPCTFPAYQDTSVAARSYDMDRRNRSIVPPKDKEEEEANKEERAKEEEENNKSDVISPEKQKDVERKYRKAGRIINRCKQANA